LLCISKESFEKLFLVTQEFPGNDNARKLIPAQAPRIKSLPRTPVPVLHSNEKNNYSWYTPTKIWATRYSEFWQWQRVSEWHREYGQDEITNEKRHILV
jgi:hypothetical protein